MVTQPNAYIGYNTTRYVVVSVFQSFSIIYYYFVFKVDSQSKYSFICICSKSISCVYFETSVLGARPSVTLHSAQRTHLCLVSLALWLFLPRDATQSAVLLWQVVCPSVCLSVRNVEVL